MDAASRLRAVVFVLLVGMISVAPIKTLAHAISPGGPLACEKDEGGPGTGKGKNPCEPDSTTTTEPGADDPTTTTKPASPATPPTAGNSGSGGGPQKSPDVAAAGPVPAVGLQSVDVEVLPAPIAGAVMILSRETEPEIDVPDLPEPAGGMSSRIERLLGPVAPPALVDVMASPVVIFEALYEVLTSSGQALIIPGVALLLGVAFPGARRRILLDEAFEPGSPLEDLGP